MNPLSRPFTARSLVRFALPTVLAMLSMGLYTIVDTVLVARLVNTDALSALNIVCPVVNVTVGLGTMLAAGGSAVVARRMGEGEPERASRDFTLLTVAGALLGLGIAAAGLAGLPGLVRALGASQRLYPYCRDYLLVLLLFTPAGMLQVLFQNLIVTAGRPGLGMVLGLGAGAVNLALDYLLMAPLGLGIRGAAIGTGMGYLFSAALGLFFFASGRGSLRFRRPLWDAGLLLLSCANGSSELVSQAAAAVTTYLFNRSMLGLAGEEGVAAVTIMIYAQFLLTALFIGFSMGVAPVISYRFGEGRGLTELLTLCRRIVLALSAAVWALSLLLGDRLAAVFSPEGTTVYDLARRGFTIFPHAFLFCGWNIFASAAFTAVSDGRTSALLSFLRTFGLIGLLLAVLPRYLGIDGVWLAVPAAEAITAAVAAGVFRAAKRRWGA